MTFWYNDVDWQIVGFLALSVGGWVMLLVVSRVRPRRTVKLKSEYWKQ